MFVTNDCFGGLVPNKLPAIGTGICIGIVPACNDMLVLDFMAVYNYIYIQCVHTRPQEQLICSRKSHES